MNDLLKRCLDDLEARIVSEQEESLLAEWTDFCEGRFTGDLFTPHRTQSAPARIEWPKVRVNEALDDFDKMALQQYGGASGLVGGYWVGVPCVRANYGTGILPLLFGTSLFVMPEEMDTLPTAEPLHDVNAIRRLLDAGVPDLSGGYGARVFEMGERFAAIAREYPKIGKHVQIYHPDIQGPLDVAEVVWGSEVFLALYEEPELVRDFLGLVTETYAAFLRRWNAIAPPRPGCNAHWGFVHGGAIMLREDSGMNISPEIYAEFVRPFDQRLLDEFGGGAVHFCGRGDHYIASVGAMPGVRAVNMSQTHLNDVETILRHTVDRGICLLDMNRPAAEAALAAGRDLHGRVHCW